MFKLNKGMKQTNYYKHNCYYNCYEHKLKFITSVYEYIFTVKTKL